MISEAPGVISEAPEMLAVPAPLEAPSSHVETQMVSHERGKTGLRHIYWLYNVHNPDILLSNPKCLLIRQNYDTFEFAGIVLHL